MKHLILLLAVACLLIVLTPCAALAAPSYDQAIDQLIKKGYPQRIEQTLCSCGTSEKWGFRFAGSTADDEAARFLAKEMRAIGLTNVHLEPVLADEQEFHDAWLQVGGTRLDASPWGGSPPTSLSGITAPIVYAGRGTAADFDALKAQGVDVAGKLVLVDLRYTSWQQMNLPAAEAVMRGAVGAILTFAPDDPMRYAQANALGEMDGYWDLSFPPSVYVSWASGEWLKNRIAEGPTTATLVNDNPIITAEQGGLGYNVYGELPGRSRSDEKIVLDAHHDAFFRAGMDATGGCTEMLLMAKAMRTSGDRPDRSLVFLFTTGEEYGRANAYYDWCSGAWTAATQDHNDWPGKVAALLSMEMQAEKGAPLTMFASSDIAPWLDQLAASESAPGGHLANGYSVGGISTWNDQWTYTAEGIPSVMFGSFSWENYPLQYHTQFENIDDVDYQSLGELGKFYRLVIGQLDSGLLPYDFEATADALDGAVSDSRLIFAGVPQEAVQRLSKDIQDFKGAAAEFNGGKDSVPDASVPAVNRELMLIAKGLNENLTALDAWDVSILPHEQVLKDVEALNAALAAIGAWNKADALAALTKVDLTWYGVNFSYETYLWDRSRHLPGFPILMWAEQGKLPAFLDVMPQYRQIEAGDFTSPEWPLTQMRNSQVEDLTDRVNLMSDALEAATAQIETIL